MTGECWDTLGTEGCSLSALAAIPTAHIQKRGSPISPGENERKPTKIHLGYCNHALNSSLQGLQLEGTKTSRLLAAFPFSQRVISRMSLDLAVRNHPSGSLGFFFLPDLRWVAPLFHFAGGSLLRRSAKLVSG